VGPEGKAQKDHRHWQDALLEGRFQAVQERLQVSYSLLTLKQS
jgi:hypothetical protein